MNVNFYKVLRDIGFVVLDIIVLGKSILYNKSLFNVLLTQLSS